MKLQSFLLQRKYITGFIAILTFIIHYSIPIILLSCLWFFIGNSGENENKIEFSYENINNILNRLPFPIIYKDQMNTNATKLSICTNEVDLYIDQQTEKIFKVTKDNDLIYMIPLIQNSLNESLNRTILNNIYNVGLIVCKDKKVIFSNEFANSLCKTNLLNKETKIIPILNNKDIYMEDYKLEIEYKEISESEILYTIKKIQLFPEIFHKSPFKILMLNKYKNILYQNDFILGTKRNIKSIDYFSNNRLVQLIDEKINTLQYVLNSENKKELIQLIFYEEFTFLFIFPVDVNNTDVYEQRINSLGNMVSNISHDYNNIIMSILNISHLLYERYKKNKDDFLIKYLTHIKHSASKAGNLIKKILDYSKPSYTEKVIEVNELISDFICTIGRVLNVDIQFNKCNQNPSILIDEIQFEQVLVNLIVNAKQANIDTLNSVVISTEVVSFNQPTLENGMFVGIGEYVLIKVTDHGIGIPSELITKIFDPFFSTKGNNGTGLGLSIVKEIVRKFQGIIKVESLEKKGTSFLIYLPICNNKNLKNINNIQTVLLVEDDPIILSVTADGLKSNGFEVLCAANSDEAIKKANISTPNILIADINIPTMNGTNLYKILKEKFPNMKVIFMTGYTNITDNTINNSVILKKPFGLDELLMLIS